LTNSSQPFTIGEVPHGHHGVGGREDLDDHVLVDVDETDGGSQQKADLLEPERRVIVERF
jgi:hypothetical protein